MESLLRQEHSPASGQPRDILRHYLGDIVFGALDGLVTTFAIVSGVAGAGLSSHIVLILGVANLLADGFSMGAADYLATRSDAFAHDRDRGRLEPFRHALFTFGSFVLIGAVPLFSYLLFDEPSASYAVSAALTGAALFAVGGLRSIVTPVHWFRGGCEMLFIGAMAAAVAFGVGHLLSGVAHSST